MHDKTFPILGTEDPPVNGVSDDERSLEDPRKSMVNGVSLEPGRDYHDPPVNGLGDEGRPNENMQMNKAQDRDSVLEDEGKSMNDLPPDGKKAF